MKRKRASTMSLFDFLITKLDACTERANLYKRDTVEQAYKKLLEEKENELLEEYDWWRQPDFEWLVNNVIELIERAPDITPERQLEIYYMREDEREILTLMYLDWAGVK